MQELTNAQREYFKDSQMRNSNGELITCYHCTSHDFDVFDKSKIGEGRDVGFLGKGFYFTTDDSYCNEYGDNKYECYINIKNPLVINDTDYIEIMDIMDYLKENHPDYGKPGGPIELAMDADDDTIALTPEDFNGPTFFLGLWQDYSKQLTDYAKENGYDGILADPPGTGDVFEIVVFEPNQIKSIDNLYPTKSNNFKDNSREYLKENNPSFDERKEISKAIKEKHNGEQTNKRSPTHQWQKGEEVI